MRPVSTFLIMLLSNSRAALPGADFDIHKNIDNIDRILSQGACFTAALPPVFRECAGRYENLLSQIEKMVPTGAVMIRNYEEYLFLRETGFDKNVILDHNPIFDS